MKKIILITIILTASIISGCFETVNSHSFFSSRLTASYVRSRWLPFPETGVLSREKVKEMLGQPSSSFENGRIYIYRLIINEWENGLSDDAYFRYNLNRPPEEILESNAQERFEKINSDGTLLVVRKDNIEQYEKEIISSIGEFNLVLVFSAEGALSRDSLISIRP